MLLLTCGFIPLWVIGSTSAEGYPAWPGALAATLIAGARYAWIAASSRRRLFEMTTWLYFYLFLGLAPLLQLRERWDTSTTPNLDHTFDWAAITIVIVAEVALIAGSFFGRHHDAKVPIHRLPSRVVDPGRAAMMTVGACVAGVAYIGLIGFSALVNNRADRSAALSTIIGDEVVRAIVTSFVSMGLLVAVVSLFHSRRQTAAGSRRPTILLALSLLLLFAIVNPIGSPRYVVGVVVLGILAALGVFRTLTGHRAIAIGAIAAMLVIFPVLDTFRSSSTASLQFVSPLEALKSGDFDSFGQIVNTAWFVDDQGLSLGRQLIGVLLFWVPRSLWPDKPLDTGVLLAEAKGYWFTNLSAPLPAELFINFGWVGVVLGLVAVGYFLRRWDANSESQLRQFGIPTILGSIVPFYLILVLRGSLLQSMANLTVILLTWFLVTRKSADSAGVRSERK